MGVSITCKNSKYDFDMSYGGFFSIRKNVAYCIDHEFGELYKEIISCYSYKDCNDYDEKMDNYINSHSEIFPEENNDVLDFLFMSDCEGKIKHKTYRFLYENHKKQKKD